MTEGTALTFGGNMALAAFLNKYDTILFDMDGVITSEQSYWTTAALTVWEWLNKDKINVHKTEEEATQIRKRVFCEDKLISLLKNKGVNSNWDLGYVVYAVCKILDTDDFNSVLRYCEAMSDNILDEYPKIAKMLSDKIGSNCERNGKLWLDMMLTFQEWFLGDELFQKTYGRKPRCAGKRGFIYSEKPIIPPEKLKNIFDDLAKSGKRLATATGRPSAELISPLKSFGIFDKFAADGIVTYDNVRFAEEKLSMTLTKPHPYIFLKAMLGESYSDDAVVKGEYDKSQINRTLVVGDAGADIIASKAMGADFCAVLTGVSGERARSFFEELGAEYILSSLEDFIV